MIIFVKRITPKSKKEKYAVYNYVKITEVNYISSVQESTT